MDVAALDWADMVVACMDGPDPDSGTAWECGYAYAKGKPIVCFRTDFRISGDTKGAPYNLMLTESAAARLEVPFRTKASKFHKLLLAQIRRCLRRLANNRRARPSRRALCNFAGNVCNLLLVFCGLKRYYRRAVGGKTFARLLENKVKWKSGRKI